MTAFVLVSADLIKSHVKGYTKTDGTVVKPHEDKRVKKPRVEMRSDVVHANKDDPKAYRAAAFEIVKAHYSGKPPVAVSVISDGAHVFVGFGGLKHVLKDGTPSWRESLAALHAVELMRSAAHVESMPDRKGRTEIKAVHIYRALAVIDGKNESIRIVVREHSDGKRYYDHSLDEKDEAPAGLLADPPPSGSESLRPFTEASVVTVSEKPKPAKWSSGAAPTKPTQPGLWGGSPSWSKDAPKPQPKAYHTKPGDKGQKVGIYSPHIPSVAALSDPGEIATITPGCEMPESLNGIAFAPWTPPAEDQWDYVDGQKDDLVEPDLHCPAGKLPASGLVIVETDGRVWLVSPTNKFGGYAVTFPKGKVEEEMSFQANAIKEAWEEAGIKANIVGLLGDVERTTSVTRYYLARRVAGNPAADCGWESQAVHLCPISKLTGCLDAKVDHQVVDLMAR